MRRAARVDDNQSEIVAAFRRLGWSVLIISQLKNCCDLFVSKYGRTIAIEVKDGAKPPSAQKLTAGEAAFFESWRGVSAIVKTVDDVLAIDSATLKISDFADMDVEDLDKLPPIAVAHLLEDLLRLFRESRGNG